MSLTPPELPAPLNSVQTDDQDKEDGLLLRAADLIGQLGDPHHLRKVNALYHEFEKVGMNRQLGYTSPADLTDSYPQFFWSSISPHIQTAIPYLNVTSRGRQWIAGLYRNVLRARRRRLDEPQPKHFWSRRPHPSIHIVIHPARRMLYDGVKTTLAKCITKSRTQDSL